MAARMATTETASSSPSAAREALEAHRWQEAFDLLTQTDRERALGPDDLEALAQAAWFSAQPDLALEAKERAFKAQVDAGNKTRAAFLAFDRFLGNLHGGARLLSLLRENPGLLSLVALLLGTAPRLADILALHPQVMDALIEPSFFGALPDADRLASDLAAALNLERNYRPFTPHHIPHDAVVHSKKTRNALAVDLQNLISGP